MSVQEQPAASRQFVASSATLSSKWSMKRLGILTYAIIVVMIGALILGNVMHLGFAAIVGILGLFFLAGLGICGYLWWRSRQRIVIGVTLDGLTINQKPGHVFSLVDAKLGPWTTMGVALHLQSGSARFLLGGRDRRIAPTTRLDTASVQNVDAWLWSPNFDELLSIGGRRSGLNIRGPAPGEPTRCLLYPNPLLAADMSKFAIGKQMKLQRSVSHPSLAIDLDNDAIRVINPNDNSLSAAASPAQVSATPAIYGRSYRHMVPTAEHVASDAMGNYLNTVPGMVICVPGRQPLTIGCRDFVGLQP
jgi:hypothetical protein